MDILFLLNIVALCIPLLFCLFLLKTERRDIHCEVLADDATCNGDGMSWAGSRPNNEDDVSTLLDKIKKASNAEVKSIKWRRSFILATVLVYIVVVLGMLYGESSESFGGELSFPDARNVYILLTLFFVAIFFTYHYYSCHVYNIPREHIRNSINMIEDKMRI